LFARRPRSEPSGPFEPFGPFESRAWIAQRDLADKIVPMLAEERMEKTEPAEPTDRIEPAEPIDKIEPAEPIDKIDPTEPIDKIEPAEPIESTDRCEPIESGPVATAPMWAFSQRCPLRTSGVADPAALAEGSAVSPTRSRMIPGTVT
jgi:hypothetical protein